MKIRILILTCMLLASFSASADELQMIISGTAIHQGSIENRGEPNEKNYGLGLQYDINQQRDWIPTINMASFKDSNDNTSRYVGGGIKRRYRFDTGTQKLNLDFGAIALVMQRPEYNDDEPFFGAVPFVSFSNGWGGINATYVPETEVDTLAFWYFQSLSR